MQPRQLLNDFLSINNQSSATRNRPNHEAISLFLLHTLRVFKKQTFALAGSEDLRALLPKLTLQAEGDEAFLFIRPYIHSMAIYCRYTNDRLYAYIFDSQSWGTRYYPTRLMIEAINQHYPDATIILSGTELQSQSNQLGCIGYAIAFLDYCKNEGYQFFTRDITQASPLKNYRNTFVNADGNLPAVLLETSMDQNPNWAVSMVENIGDQIDEILYQYLSDERRFDFGKIRADVREMQGVNLPTIKVLDVPPMYHIEVDQRHPSITFIFNNKDWVYKNFLMYSDAIYPSCVDPRVSTQKNASKHHDEPKILLNNGDDISVTYNATTFRLTYSASSLEILEKAFASLVDEADDLYHQHMRQQAALMELSREVDVHLKFANICQNTSGGLDQQQVQLALAAEFEHLPNVYVPAISDITGDQASLPLPYLARLGYTHVAFTTQTGSVHQVGVLVKLDNESSVVTVFDSESSHSLTVTLRKRLQNLLNVDESSIGQEVSPYEPQGDDWACGAYVVAMLIRAYHQLAAETSERPPLLVKKMGLKYYRHYLNQRDKSESKELEKTNNEKKLREFLELVELKRYSKSFYSNVEQVVGDDYWPLAQFLQMSAWGNTDRKLTPTNNTDRKMEALSFLLNQPLENLYAQFIQQHQNPRSLSARLFQLYIIVSNDAGNLSDAQVIDMVDKLDTLLKLELPVPISRSPGFWRTKLDEDKYINPHNAQMLLEQEIIQYFRSEPDAKYAHRTLLKEILTNIENKPLLACLNLIMYESDPTEQEAANQAVNEYYKHIPLEYQYAITQHILHYVVDSYSTYEVDMVSDKKRLCLEQQAYLDAHQADLTKLNDFIVHMQQLGVSLPLPYMHNAANLKRIVRQIPAIEEHTCFEYFRSFTAIECESLVENLLKHPEKHTAKSIFQLYPLAKVKSAYQENLIDNLIKNLQPTDFDRPFIQFLISCVDSKQFIELLSRIMAQCVDADLVHNATYLFNHQHLLLNPFEFNVLLMRSDNLLLLFVPGITYNYKVQIEYLSTAVAKALQSPFIMPLFRRAECVRALISMNSRELALITSSYTSIVVVADLFPVELLFRYPVIASTFLNENAIAFLMKKIFPSAAYKYVFKQINAGKLPLADFINVSEKWEHGISRMLNLCTYKGNQTESKYISEIIIRNLLFINKYLPRDLFSNWDNDKVSRFVGNLVYAEYEDLSDAMRIFEGSLDEYFQALVRDFDVNNQNLISEMAEQVSFDHYIMMLVRIQAHSTVSKCVVNASNLLELLFDNNHMRTLLGGGSLAAVDASTLSMNQISLHLTQVDTHGKLRQNLLCEEHNRTSMTFLLTPGRYKALQKIYKPLKSCKIGSVNEATLNYLSTNECDGIIKNDLSFLQRAFNMPLQMAQLYVALKSKATERVRLLIKNGADINCRDSNNCSLLMYAMEEKDDDTVKCLQSLGASIRSDKPSDTSFPFWTESFGVNSIKTTTVTVSRVDDGIRDGRYYPELDPYYP